MVKREIAATIMLANPSLPPEVPFFVQTQGLSAADLGEGLKGGVYVCAWGGEGGQAPPYVG